MNNETMMTAEEFFGEPATAKTPATKSRARGKKSRDDLFTEAKIKMVMRIYGVPRKRALGIIAGRHSEKEELLDSAGKRRPKRRRGYEEEDSGELLGVEL